MDESVNFSFKKPEKMSFGHTGGLGGLGGFMVQGLAGSVKLSDQFLIQALFFKFPFLSTTYGV